MNRIGLTLALSLGAFLTVGMSPARAAEPADAPRAVVEKLHEAELKAMKGGAKLGFDGRRAVLDPAVREAYDLPTMARVACGAAWMQMTDEQKKQVVDTFTDWTVATNASQFKDWGGESFVIKGETEGARGRTAIQAEIVAKGDDPTDLVYQMREDAEGRWKIVDVYVDGSVSQIALRRSDMSAVLKKSGADGLVAEMKKQTTQLAKGG